MGPNNDKKNFSERYETTFARVLEEKGTIVQKTNLDSLKYGTQKKAISEEKLPIHFNRRIIKNSFSLSVLKL